MKKKPVMLITILFGISLIVFACRREFANYAKDKPKVAANLLDSVKVYNAQILKQTAADRAKVKDFYLVQPKWDESWTLKSPAGLQLVIVPTTENLVNDRSIEIRRVYVFTFLDGVVASGKILELVGINYSVNKNLDYLLMNYRKPVIEDFNGAIIQYDLAYRWTNGRSYVNGKIEPDKASLSRNVKDGYNPNNPGLYLKSFQSNKSKIGNQTRIKFLSTISVKSNSSGNGNKEMSNQAKKMEIKGSTGNAEMESGTGENVYGGNPAFELDAGTGLVVEAVTSGGISAYLCGGIEMHKVYNSYNASMSELGFVLYVTPQGQQTVTVFAIWNFACVEIPNYSTFTNTDTKAAYVFMSTYDTCLDLTIAGVKSHAIPYNQFSVQSFFKTEILDGLNSIQLGSTFSTGSACFAIKPLRPRYCILKPRSNFNSMDQQLVA